MHRSSHMFNLDTYLRCREDALKGSNSSFSARIALDLNQLQMLSKSLKDFDSVHSCVFLSRAIEDVVKNFPETDCKVELRRILVTYFCEPPFDRPTLGESVLAFTSTLKGSIEHWLEFLNAFCEYMNGYKLPAPGEISHENGSAYEYRLTYYRWMMFTSLPRLFPTLLDKDNLLRSFSCACFGSAFSVIQRDFRDFVDKEFFPKKNKSLSLWIYREMIDQIFDFIKTYQTPSDLSLNSAKLRDLAVVCVGPDASNQKSKRKSLRVDRTCRSTPRLVTIDDVPEHVIEEAINALQMDEVPNEMDMIEFKVISFDLFDEFNLSEFPALWNISDLMTTESNEQNFLNHEKRRQVGWLTQARDVFMDNLTQMPGDYVTKLVFDNRHRTIVMLKPSFENNVRTPRVIGALCFRPFLSQRMSEIVFCAVTNSEQVRGYGTMLINQCKSFNIQKGILHLMTYADGNAVEFFQKQGFSDEISEHGLKFKKYLKEYTAAILMECILDPEIDYVNMKTILKLETGIMSALDGYFVRKSLDPHVGRMMKLGTKLKVGNVDTEIEMKDTRLQERIGELLQKLSSHDHIELILKLPELRSGLKTKLRFPIDFTTIQKRFEQNYYSSTHLILADLRRCFVGFREHYSLDKTTKRTELLRTIEADYRAHALRLDIINSNAEIML